MKVSASLGVAVVTALFLSSANATDDSAIIGGVISTIVAAEYAAAAKSSDNMKACCNQASRDGYPTYAENDKQSQHPCGSCDNLKNDAYDTGKRWEKVSKKPKYIEANIKILEDNNKYPYYPMSAAVSLSALGAGHAVAVVAAGIALAVGL